MNTQRQRNVRSIPIKFGVFQTDARAAAARPEVLPRADGRAIGKPALAAATRPTKSPRVIRTGRAFTLVEVLVVTGITATLLGILLPVAGRARLQAKVVAVHAELRDIGLALEAYSFDHEGKYPPVRVDCMLGGHFYQLPCELTDGGYLPKPPPDTFLAAGMEDRFNRGYTYKYRSVGPLIYNRTTVIEDGAYLWVPDGFPDHERQEGRTYNKLKESPVSWVLYSEGPGFNERRMKEMQYPVPRATWFNGPKAGGVIVRMRLQNGRQIGSFEG